MLSREDKRSAYRQIEKIRKNPPIITQEHRDGAKQLLKQHEKNETKKDEEIKGELKDFSRDLAGFVHNHTQGVGKIFHGFGVGKKVICRFPSCQKHESQMHNMNDGKWYCQEHRWFGNLTEQQKRKERLCLLTKQKKK